MLSKILIIGIFLGIVVSMGSALSFLIKDKGQSNRTLHALTVRIIVSIALFALLFVLWGLGLISPHGIRPWKGEKSGREKGTQLFSTPGGIRPA